MPEDWVGSGLSSSSVRGLMGPSFAADPAFATRYVSGTSSVGAPGGRGVQAEEYWDTTAKRKYVSDGTGWVIMSEPLQTFVPNVVSSAGAIVAYTTSMGYHRSNGYLEFELFISVTNNGTGAGFISITVPIDSAEQMMGYGREINVTGFMLEMSRQAASTAQIETYVNGYPAGNGYDLRLHGRYRMKTRYS